MMISSGTFGNSRYVFTVCYVRLIFIFRKGKGKQSKEDEHPLFIRLCLSITLAS